MAPSRRVEAVLFLCLVISVITCSPRVQAQVGEIGIQLMTDALEWPSAMSLYDDDDGGEPGDKENAIDGAAGRRSLFWRTMRYYISYGALAANRVPCPPRSGRSYYTHNCFRARGPIHPYNRGCSAITRCRR